MPKASPSSSKAKKDANTTAIERPERSRKSSLKSILKKPRSPTPEPLEEDEDEVIGSGSNSNASDKEGSDEEGSFHLQGFSDDEQGDSDSSDEEDGVVRDIQSGDLPTVVKDDAAVRKRLEKAKRDPAPERGVVYLGHIPHGFYEEQMKGFFTQFGTITRLRLSRSKKTGRSKGYGFIEFESAAVATIVADVMDNYLLFGRIMKCKIVSQEKVHPSLWVGANKPFKLVPHKRVAQKAHNKKRTAEQQDKVDKRLLSRQRKRVDKLKALGIDYDLSSVGYAQITPVAS